MLKITHMKSQQYDFSCEFIDKNGPINSFTQRNQLNGSELLDILSVLYFHVTQNQIRNDGTAPSGQRGRADFEGTGVCLFQNQEGTALILLVFHFSFKRLHVERCSARHVKQMLPSLSYSKKKLQVTKKTREMSAMFDKV